MKKLLGILVISLLWCNVGVAKITFSKCSGLEPNYGYNDSWTIDLEKGVIKETTRADIAFYIITKNYGDTIVASVPVESETITSQKMQLLSLYYDVHIMFDLENKRISQSVSPKLNTPKAIKKRWKKLVDNGEAKEHVKGSCAVENLYAKKEKPKKKEPKQSPDDHKILAAASGTGFFVTKDGHMVTNHHVIEGCNAVKANIKGKEIPADIIATDKKNDLAIIKANMSPNKVFSVSNEDVSLLENVIVAGFPLGKKVSAAIKTHKGSVTALAGFGDNYSNFQTDATINEGNSGGPIINQKGNVVGVAVALLPAEKAQNIFFGVKSSTLKTFAKSNNINFLPPNYRDMSNRDLGTLITGGTVFLECWMTVAKIKQMIAQAENRKAFYSEHK